MWLSWTQVNAAFDPTAFALCAVPALVPKQKAQPNYCDSERLLADAINRLGII